MTPNMSAATNKRETKRGAPRPIRHMHAAVQPNRAINDCEEKRDPDERDCDPKRWKRNDEMNLT
ncbi:hypothetical protein GCM10011315_42120 [Roseovarius pacificus]|nr:hypothetical protein GCM10011315_42120 [Roseovarius pacificus]